VPLEAQDRLEAAPVGRGGQLGLRAGVDRALLADGDEPHAQLECCGGSQHEAASLDPGNLPHAGTAKRIGHRRPCLSEESPVGPEADCVRVAVEVLESCDEFIMEAGQEDPIVTDGRLAVVMRETRDKGR
jgi:hypothetical protein